MSFLGPLDPRRLIDKAREDVEKIEHKIDAAGRKIDDAAENFGHMVEDLGENVGRTVDDVAHHRVDPKTAWDHLMETPFGPAAPRIQGNRVDDFSRMDAVTVNRVVAPKTEKDIAQALAYARDRGLKVSVAGARHSMGGQAVYPNSVLLDMTSLNQFSIDPKNMTMTVQTGAKWVDIQHKLDPMGLSVDVMQTPNIFTVGGALSVNAHGSNPNSGPIASTVQSFRLMKPDGTVVNCSPTENPDLFKNALGGYGGFGVIVDATLSLQKNVALKPVHINTNYRDYPALFDRDLSNEAKYGQLHAILNTDPNSPGFLKDVTVEAFQKIPGKPPKMNDDAWGPFKNALGAATFQAAKGDAVGKAAYWKATRDLLPAAYPSVVSRNQVMSEPLTAFRSFKPGETQILQEYFIPRDKVADFVDDLRATAKAHPGANLWHAAFRAVKADDATGLPYAPQDVIGVVLFFDTDTKPDSPKNKELKAVTNELVDAAGKEGGRNYLPYQLTYSPDQLRANYPEVDKFLAAKRAADPTGLMMNGWYAKYGGNG